MDVEKFRDVINQREATDDEWDYGVQQCLKQELEILSSDIASTIEYLRTECTAKEFSWISEVFEELIENNPSKELVESYKALIIKYPEESERYYIIGTVENAEAILKWEEENGKK